MGCFVCRVSGGEIDFVIYFPYLGFVVFVGSFLPYSWKPYVGFCIHRIVA